MSLLNLYQTSNNWLKYKNSDFNISVEATRWAEPKEALCVSSAWNLERRTALWGPILQAVKTFLSRKVHLKWMYEWMNEWKKNEWTKND